MEQWGFDPVPDEPLRRVPVTFGVINVWVYGMNTWGDLFNARQKLALITFVEKVREAHDRMLAEGYEPEFAKAVVTYLGLSFSKVADRNNTCSTYQPSIEGFVNTFGRQALRMTWEYPEIVPIFETVGYLTALEWNLEVLKNLIVTPIKHEK